MGNCQAIDAAALVIQHPSGSVERMYWPVSVSEVMKMNPGHYVSLIIPLPINSSEENTDEKTTVRFTRVKLLRPSDTLVLGRAYRLVTTEEVLKLVRAKKHAKMKNNQPESTEKAQIQFDPENKQSSNCEAEAGKSELKKTSQAMRHEIQRRQRAAGPSNPVAARSKSWRPSLLSISEGVS